MESKPKLSQSGLLEYGEREELRREQLLEESGWEQKHEEESPEMKHQRELFVALSRFTSPFEVFEEKNEREVAKMEIEQMGDAGVDLILRGIDSQQLRPYYAIRILSEFDTEKSIQAMESLLFSAVVAKDADRNARVQLLRLLSAKDKSSSIPPIADFTNRTLENLDKLIETKVDLMSERESEELMSLMDDVQEAIGGLQKFTDREGFNQAEELYKKFNEARERVDALRKEQQGQSQEKLKTILGKPFELNLQEFPQATDEEAASIDSILGNFQSDLDLSMMKLF